MKGIEPIRLSARTLGPALLVGYVGLAVLTSLVPDAYRVLTMIVVPAVLMAVLVPLAVRRWMVQPIEDDVRAANDAAQRASDDLDEEIAVRAGLRELDRGLDHAADEIDALTIVHRALVRQQHGRACELHLVETVDPVMTLRVATSPDARAGERTSPWDSVAARNGTTLTYGSTEQLDVCPHLRSRTEQAQSAVAVPLHATGRLLGVLYVFDREGVEFGSEEVADLEDLAGIIAARIAVLRAVAPAKHTDAADRLTGLPDRAAMQDRMIRLLETRQSFSLAVADIDAFGSINESFGREAADRVLQTVATVARQTLRPDDQVGRIGGDELLLVFPETSSTDAIKALERVREELAIAQSTTDDPTATLSIGVIGSTSGGSIEDLLQRAAGALNHAKGQGGNRVVVAQPAPKA